MPTDMLTTMLATMTWVDWALMIVLSLPPLLVIYSKRVHGGRKFLWFVLTSLFSWLAYVPFLMSTRAKPEVGDGPAAQA